jgi:hypothetical protein
MALLVLLLTLCLICMIVTIISDWPIMYWGERTAYMVALGVALAGSILILAIF